MRFLCREGRRLVCLDGVLARFDAVRRAAATVREPITDAVSQALVDPEMCALREPPHLVLAPTQTIAALALLAETPEARDHDSRFVHQGSARARRQPCTRSRIGAADREGVEPCARALALLAVAAATAEVGAHRAVDVGSRRPRSVVAMTTCERRSQSTSRFGARSTRSRDGGGARAQKRRDRDPTNPAGGSGFSAPAVRGGLRVPGPANRAMVSR